MITDQELDAEFCEETDADVDLTVPEAGFLLKYYSLACPITEAPEIYHLFTGMSLIAGVLGRKVFLDWTSYKIYPNLYIILVGASSAIKKSTSINIARPFLSAVDHSLIFPNEFSNEAFLELLVTRPQGSFYWDEFGGVLSTFERSYMSGTKEMLTSMFDCPNEHQRLLKANSKTQGSSKTVIIRDPYINIVTTSTLEWLVNRIKEQDVKSGFLARFVYVPGKEPSKRLSRPPKLDQCLKSEIILELKAIREISGEAELTPEAFRHYDFWYNSIFDQMQTGDNRDRLTPFFSRLLVYALKFALIYQVSEDHELLIQEHNMIRACQLVDFLKRNIKDMVENELVFGVDAIQLKKVLDIIKSVGAIERSKLFARVNFRKDILNKLIETLLEQELISVNREQVHKGKKPRTIYTFEGKRT